MMAHRESHQSVWQSVKRFLMPQRLQVEKQYWHRISEDGVLFRFERGKDELELTALGDKVVFLVTEDKAEAETALALMKERFKDAQMILDNSVGERSLYFLFEPFRVSIWMGQNHIKFRRMSDSEANVSFERADANDLDITPLSEVLSRIDALK